MHTDLPSELRGNHPLASWSRKLLRAIRRRTPLEGLGYKLRQTERGFTHEILLRGGGGQPTEYKLFQVTVASPDSSTAVNTNEVRLADDGLLQIISTFGAIAKPLHLRPESKPSTTHVVYPGYTPTFVSGIWLTGTPRTWGLIIGFRPAFGTGIEDVEWMDTGLITRDWAVPIEMCENGVPMRRYLRGSSAFV